MSTGKGPTAVFYRIKLRVKKGRRHRICAHRNPQPGVRPKTIIMPRPDLSLPIDASILSDGNYVRELEVTNTNQKGHGATRYPRVIKYASRTTGCQHFSVRLKTAPSSANATCSNTHTQLPSKCGHRSPRSLCPYTGSTVIVHCQWNSSSILPALAARASIP